MMPQGMRPPYPTYYLATRTPTPFHAPPLVVHRILEYALDELSFAGVHFPLQVKLVYQFLCRVSTVNKQWAFTSQRFLLERAYVFNIKQALALLFNSKAAEVTRLEIEGGVWGEEAPVPVSVAAQLVEACVSLKTLVLRNIHALDDSVLYCPTLANVKTLHISGEVFSRHPDSTPRYAVGSLARLQLSNACTLCGRVLLRLAFTSWNTIRELHVYITSDNLPIIRDLILLVGSNLTAFTFAAQQQCKVHAASLTTSLTSLQTLHVNNFADLFLLQAHLLYPVHTIVYLGLMDTNSDGRIITALLDHMQPFNAFKQLKKLVLPRFRPAQPAQILMPGSLEAECARRGVEVTTTSWDPFCA